MGADAARLIQWVSLLGVRFVTCGIALALLASWMLRDAVASLLLDVAPADPVTILRRG